MVFPYLVLGLIVQVLILMGNMVSEQAKVLGISTCLAHEKESGPHVRGCIENIIT